MPAQPGMPAHTCMESRQFQDQGSSFFTIDQERALRSSTKQGMGVRLQRVQGPKSVMETDACHA
jgi:hypothetical protein